MPTYKRCPRCTKNRHRRFFKADPRTKDGLHCWCIDCYRAYYRAYNSKHSKARIARVKIYEATPKGKLATYKKGAKQRGIPWRLSPVRFHELRKTPCFWCGGSGGGIDRFDNRKSYTHRNCVPCCKACNIAKNKFSVQEFVKWLERITTHLSALKKNIKTKR